MEMDRWRQEEIRDTGQEATVTVQTKESGGLWQDGDSREEEWHRFYRNLLELLRDGTQQGLGGGQRGRDNFR